MAEKPSAFGSDDHAWDEDYSHAGGFHGLRLFSERRGEVRKSRSLTAFGMTTQEGDEEWPA